MTPNTPTPAQHAALLALGYHGRPPRTPAEAEAFRRDWERKIARWRREGSEERAGAVIARQVRLLEEEA